MKISHPSFKNPTIAEALCEIHFVSNIQVLPEKIESTAKSLAISYPQLEKKEIREVRAEIGPHGVSIAPVGEGVPRVVMKHGSRNHLVQISPSCITINELDKYPGWEIFLSDIRTIWEHFSKEFSIQSIQRVGLRYINRIPRKFDEPVAEWLGPSDFYPRQILSARSFFASRFESINPDKIRTIVTLAEGVSDTNHPPLIFDIDCIAEIPQSPEWASLSITANNLHQDIWKVFNPSITQKLQEYLDRGEQS